jgi:hypothetical protein
VKQSLIPSLGKQNFPFMKTILILNLLYFLLVSFLHQKALNNKRFRYPGEAPMFRNNLIEFTSEWCWPDFSIKNSRRYEDDRREVLLQVYWIFGKLFLHLPLKPWFRGEWGIGLFNCCGGFPDQIYINYGKKHKFIDLPWMLEYCLTKYLLKDGSWALEGRGHKIIDRWEESFKARLLTEVHPYLYILKDGTNQPRTATITYETRNWRRKWLKFTDLFSYTRPTISIDFDREIGERSGSWKGGTVGCSFDLKPGETGEQALRRMEATRKF